MVTIRETFNRCGYVNGGVGGLGLRGHQVKITKKFENVVKVKNFLNWGIFRSNFQEVIQSANLHTFTNKQVSVIFITSSNSLIEIHPCSS